MERFLQFVPKKGKKNKLDRILASRTRNDGAGCHDQETGQSYQRKPRNSGGQQNSEAGHKDQQAKENAPRPLFGG